MNCVICGVVISHCGYGGTDLHPGLCCRHFDPVNNDDYRRGHYETWRDAGCTGTTSGFVPEPAPNILPPLSFALDHQCEDAVHRGAADRMCEAGCGQCNNCRAQCDECGSCNDCVIFCSASGSYCCSCMDDHHCSNCNSIIDETVCENDFLCSRCCDCVDTVEYEPEEAYRSTSSIGNSLIETWRTIKRDYIGECAKCSNSMLACICIDY